MGTFFLYEPEEIFNDELYEDIAIDSFEYINDFITNVITPKFGDCILYNKHLNSIYIRKFIDLEKQLESSVIGIVLQTNDDGTIDCIMKNFLTTEPLKCDIRNIVLKNNAAECANMKLLFDRYNQKYKRNTNMEFIKTINYYIPNITLLDYLWQNKSELFDIIAKIYDNDKATSFAQLFYKGILSMYKNKLYVWMPYQNQPREIKHLIQAGLCQFLSCFTLINNFTEYS